MIMQLLRWCEIGISPQPENLAPARELDPILPFSGGFLGPELDRVVCYSEVM